MPQFPALSLAISPCPNDTFIFHAWLHGQVPAAPAIGEVRFEDVETLNRMALAGEADIIKVSAAVIAEVEQEYVVLDAGAALGWGNGPVLTAREMLDPHRIEILALPGERTTAALLAWEYGIRPARHLIVRYDEVAPAVLEGRATAGVCIHEERFTLEQRGLARVLDFGVWWEEAFRLPLPLGVILGRRSLGEARLQAVEAAIRASVDQAWQAPAQCRDFVRLHAQSMEDAVLDAHIRTFVTDFSRSLQQQDGLGRRAVDTLTAIARRRTRGDAA
ncbi:1,4-dihydroxy-6-naphthoate synthase [Megalodesulfovibrio gigas]|uniref:1,4-dihydroxy-6-naphtoate synthase n=1 Tax=Megalodesulfovibrio gigas (strain ATCC 19364 / DSM 1382 / NCIMB 9332 / VKM B-1759) TaxID=1121448 RepID=T2GEK1_MEGG1|nr:1,4-dihydroxy-6-naphthoate synthase [Megalodesulfovibrio gigas]AGW14352.1 putative 1,4-dihydroxy-6-naphthoate synthase [Megalodesulfovibrio gigas DSM 1382 = ATCC 19364]